LSIINTSNVIGADTPGDISQHSGNSQYPNTSYSSHQPIIQPGIMQSIMQVKQPVMQIQKPVMPGQQPLMQFWNTDVTTCHPGYNTITTTYYTSSTVNTIPTTT